MSKSIERDGSPPLIYTPGQKKKRVIANQSKVNHAECRAIENKNCVRESRVDSNNNRRRR